MVNGWSKLLAWFPETCCLVVVGFAIGGILYATNTAVLSPLSSTIFFFCMLPPIILDAGYFMPNRLFFDGKKSDGVKWAFDCVYPGNDIGNTLIEFDKCGKKCVENPRCNYFSYFDNKCYLKYIENVPFRQYAAAVNCGYLPSRIVVPCQDEGTNYKPCRCKKQLNGNGTIVDCRDLSLTVLPPLNISDIDLVHFDLSGNNLTNIPQSTIDLLNKNVTLLSLAGNPWGCDCSNYYLLDFFFNWKLRIQDFQEMKCETS